MVYGNNADFCGANSGFGPSESDGLDQNGYLNTEAQVLNGFQILQIFVEPG